MRVRCIKPTLNWMKAGDIFTAEEKGDAISIDGNNGRKYSFEKWYFFKIFEVIEE